jgi:predicted secreted hydrolase
MVRDSGRTQASLQYLLDSRPQLFVCEVASAQTAMTTSADHWLLRLIMLFVVSISFSAEPTTALEIRRAYIGKHGSVHVVTEDRRDSKIAWSGRSYQVRLSANKKVVAWISAHSKDRSSLKVYYGGKIQTIRGGPFVRDFWFVDDGAKIAVDIGGMHFAGTELLYDVATSRQLDEVNQWGVPLEKRPQWSQDR